MAHRKGPAVAAGRKLHECMSAVTAANSHLAALVVESLLALFAGEWLVRVSGCVADAGVVLPVVVCDQSS
jgi:hypothetical protein